MKVAKRFLEKSYMELIKSYDVPLYLVLAKQNKKTTGEECSGEECHENHFGRFKISPNGFLFEGQSNFLQKYTIVGDKETSTINIWVDDKRAYKPFIEGIKSLNEGEAKIKIR